MPKPKVVGATAMAAVQAGYGNMGSGSSARPPEAELQRRQG